MSKSVKDYKLELLGALSEMISQVLTEETENIAGALLDPELKTETGCLVIAVTELQREFKRLAGTVETGAVTCPRCEEDLDCPNCGRGIIRRYRRYRKEGAIEALGTAISRIEDSLDSEDYGVRAVINSLTDFRNHLAAKIEEEKIR